MLSCSAHSLFGTTAEVSHEYISRDVPDEAAQESSKQTTENESDYITENYIKYLTDGSEIPNYGTYSEQSVLDILSKTVDGYVNDEYGYICFMTVAGLDNLNNAEKTVYMPRTNNGDIMLFTTISAADKPYKRSRRRTCRLLCS